MVFLIAGVLSFAAAQVNSQAAKLLEAARSAHGGAALANLRTYQETATLITYTQGQESGRLTVVSYVDFLTGQFRIEYRDGDNLIQIIQVSRAQAQTWSQQRGTHSLEAALAKDIRDGFYQTWYGLRLGESGREVVRLEGTRSFAGIKGKAVAVKTKGVETTYLFDEQSQLVAERYRNSQGTLSVGYSDVRNLGGIRIPYQASIYADGFLFAETKVVSAKINPSFASNTFKMP